MPRLTYANVMSTIAVFLALGGISWAAVKLPRNSVGSKQIKKSAVRSSDVKNGALRALDFRTGELPAGPTGPKGDKGDPGVAGAPGSARAHGRITEETPPAIAPGTGKGVDAVFRSAQEGLYCLELAIDDPRVAVATGDDVATIAAAIADAAAVETLIPEVCPAGTDAIVGTSQVTTEGVDLEWRGLTFWVE